MDKHRIQIQDLEARHPGLTTGVAMSYREAAEVCLARHHSPPTDLAVEHGSEITALAEWTVPDDRTKRAWANETDATEAGAYCVALAVIEVTDDLVAISRAETRTGADYYVAPKGTELADLERAYRLEVSGIDEGGLSSVRTRLRQKVEQALRGRSSLPAIAAVVAFSSASVAIADAEPK